MRTLKIVTMVVSDTDRDYVVRRIANRVSIHGSTISLECGPDWPTETDYENVSAIAIRTLPERDVENFEVVTE